MFSWRIHILNLNVKRAPKRSEIVTNLKSPTSWCHQHRDRICSKSEISLCFETSGRWLFRLEITEFFVRFHQILVLDLLHFSSWFRFISDLSHKLRQVVSKNWLSSHDLDIHEPYSNCIYLKSSISLSQSLSQFLQKMNNRSKNKFIYRLTHHNWLLIRKIQHEKCWVEMNRLESKLS